MKFYLGVTDNSWFNYLSTITPEDINFWQPGGNVNFKLLKPGAPFLFKLKKPLNAIGGVGFFQHIPFCPCPLRGMYSETEMVAIHTTSFKK